MYSAADTRRQSVYKYNADSAKIPKPITEDFEPTEMYGLIIGNVDYTNWGKHKVDPKKPKEKPIFDKIDSAHDDMELAKDLFLNLGFQEC